MAGPLAAIERFFERLFERPPAKLFATRVEREQLTRQLQRAMEDGRQRTGQRTYAPSLYRVVLTAEDLAALANTPRLAEDLAEGLRVHARSRGYVLRARPRVVLDASSRLGSGEVQVTTDAVPEPAAAPGAGEQAAAAAPDSLGSAGREAAARERAHAVSGASAGDAGAGADSFAADRGDTDRAASDPAFAGPARDGHTAVFEAARPRLPSAAIAVHVPGRPQWRVAVDGGRLRVGRALDNDIVLPDDRVSRHHGQINVRFGTLVYSDLGSTNGSFVNGARVSEIALGPTDVLVLGRSSLTIEPGP